MLDGRVLAMYSYQVESESDGYVKTQQAVELLNKFYGLITKYNTPEQKAKIDEANKKLYAYAHFDLARIYYLQAKYEQSNDEIAAAQAFGVDLGAIDERYSTLLGLLAQRGQKPSPSRVASVGKSNSQTSSAACDALTSKMNGELADLSTQIYSKFDEIKQINTNEQNLLAFRGKGDTLSQITFRAEVVANAKRMRDTASKKADELTAQYSATKNSYQNQLTGAGCPSN